MNHKRTLVVLFGLPALAMAALLITLPVSFSTSHAASSEPLATIEPNQYFPLELGNQWVYSWTNSLYTPSPFVETVIVAKEMSGQYTLYARHRCASGQFQISTASGYQWTSYGTSGCNPFPVPMYMLLYYLYTPENLFPASFQVGSIWSGTGSWYGVPYSGTTTVVTNTATVLVNGHTYTNCLQIRTVITGPHEFGAGTRDAWFAPDVGLVKLIYQHEDGSTTTAELRMGPRISTLFLPIIGKNFGPCSPIWFDDFSNIGSGWPIEDDQWHTFAYTGGEYQIVGKSTNWTLVASPGVRMTDGVIVVSMRFATATGGSDDNGGIVFGQMLENNWNFYRFTVRRDGSYCIQRHAATSGWVTLKCGHATGYLPYPATNRLKVVRNGSAITAYINGQFLATVFDSNYVGSLRVGLSAGSGTSSADLRFDDYGIYPVSCNDQVAANEAFNATVRALDTPEKLHEWMKANMRYIPETVNEYCHASVVYQRGGDDCDGLAIFARYVLSKHGYETWHMGVDNHAMWGHNVAPFRDRDGQLYFMDNFATRRGPYPSFQAMADVIYPGWTKIWFYAPQPEGCQFPAIVDRIER